MIYVKENRIKAINNLIVIDKWYVGVLLFRNCASESTKREVLIKLTREKSSIEDLFMNDNLFKRQDKVKDKT